MDLDKLGQFDVVLFLGVLYHMRHPLLSLERLAKVTRKVAIIETHAAYFPGFENLALCEFLELDELGGDYTNWWAPNIKAVTGMLRSAGFKSVKVIQGPPAEFLDLPANATPANYRAILQASH
jgi:tRNA (mo5U34)-methyltransferase